MQPVEEGAAQAIPRATALKNRYFLITRGAAAIEWYPPCWIEPMPKDCIYFGLAFLEMEHRSCTEGLRVYVTYDWNNLPEYGPAVVVLLLGEEIGRVPRYVRHVRAVFKTMRMRPYLGIRKCKLDLLRLSLLLKAIRDWPGYWRSLYSARRVPRDWPASLREEMVYLDVPLGYLNGAGLPAKKMHERLFDCFFAGQVMAPTKSGLLGLLPLPKNESRQSMFAAVRALKGNHPDISLDGFEIGIAPSEPALSGTSYSRRMMDAKFCLAPRGNVVDTFRFFEGMRSGCIVVCEPLPGERYYAGAPVIEVNDWSELEDKIGPLLRDIDGLEELRRRSLEWWEQQCSEAATGRAMGLFVDGHHRQ